MDSLQIFNSLLIMQVYLILSITLYNLTTTYIIVILSEVIVHFLNEGEDISNSNILLTRYADENEYLQRIISRFTKMLNGSDRQIS
jgi:hypothetical protein